MPPGVQSMLQKLLHGPDDAVGVYVHIPFCVSKCPYCDFNSFPAAGKNTTGYVEALLREIDDKAPMAAGRRLISAYLGGGTPTCLDSATLSRLLGRILSLDFAADAEVTVEANPGTLDERRLVALRESGANRLSLGVQSFDDRLLRRLGRAHTLRDNLNSFHLARKLFDNVSLDLIFGIPGQTLLGWRRTLQLAVDLRPDHVSCYSLTLSGDTPLDQAVSMGAVVLPDEDIQAEMYEAAVAILEEDGYLRYEVSNFSVSGRECSHNLLCWLNRPYLGFGAGAWSSWDGARFANLGDPEGYSNAVFRGEDPCAVFEPADPEREQDETMMLGLRLVGGVDVAGFQARFGTTPQQVYPSAGRLIASGLLEERDGCLRLTPRGFLLGNLVFREFVR